MESSSIARTWAWRSAFQYFGSLNIALGRPQLMELSIATLTLSSTLMFLNSLMFWKVLAIPALLRSAVVMPMVSRPLSSMEPLLGSYTLVSRLKTVVLPAPFGPISPVISVGPMARSNSLTASRPPKLMPSLLHSSTGGRSRSLARKRFCEGCG